MTGNQLVAMPNSIKGSLKDAVDAYYYSKNPMDTELNIEKYNEAYAAVLGMDIGEVNDVSTPLPKGLTGEAVNTALDSMTREEYIAASLMKLPPVDDTGWEVDPSVMAGATLFPLDDQGNYKVFTGDGWVRAGRADGPAFVLHLDRAEVNRVVMRAEDEATPGEATVTRTGEREAGGIGTSPSLSTYIEAERVARREEMEAGPETVTAPTVDLPESIPGITAEPTVPEAPPRAPAPPVSGMGMPTAPGAQNSTGRGPTPVPPPPEPEGPPTPRARRDSAPAQAVQRRANEMTIEAYTKVVNGMKGITRKQKDDMIAAEKKRLGLD